MDRETAIAPPVFAENKARGCLTLFHGLSKSCGRVTKSKLAFSSNVYGARVCRQGKYDGSIPIRVSVDNSIRQSPAVGREQDSPARRASARPAGVQDD